MNRENRQFRLSAFRTPLGVIGGFTLTSEIVLVVAITRDGPLASGQRTALIVLMFVLLVVTMAAFYFLVTKHHHKLYAPFEYRSDDTFIQTLSPVEKYIKEIADKGEFQEAAGGSGCVGVHSSSEGQVEGSEGGGFSRPDQAGDLRRFSFSAAEEELVSVINQNDLSQYTHGVKVVHPDGEIWINGMYSKLKHYVLIEMMGVSSVHANLVASIKKRISPLNRAIDYLVQKSDESKRENYFSVLFLLVLDETNRNAVAPLLLQARHDQIFSPHLKVFVVTLDELEYVTDKTATQVAQTKLASNVWRLLDGETIPGIY